MFWLLACIVDPSSTVVAEPLDTGEPFVETDPTFCDELVWRDQLHADTPEEAELFCAGSGNAVHEATISVPVDCLCAAYDLRIRHEGRAPRLREAGYLSYEPNRGDLRSLANLEKVTHELTLSSDLESAEGMDNLVYAYAIVVDETPLTSLDGLRGDMSAYWVIRDNPDLTDISALRGLGAAEALAIEDNPQLTSLEGLEELESAGWMALSGAITSLAPLQSLQTAEYLRLARLDLVSLDGLEALAQVADLRIEDNPVLTDLQALQGLHVESLRLGGNGALTDLRGLGATQPTYAVIADNGLQTLKPLRFPAEMDRLSLYESDLQDLSALHDLERIEQLWLGGPGITDLGGLQSLVVARELTLRETALTTLDGPQLRNMRSVDLRSNDALSDITMLHDVGTAWGDVWITDNATLGDDAAWAMVDAIGQENIHGEITISGNGP